jgi:hypothetical protein
MKMTRLVTASLLSVACALPMAAQWYGTPDIASAAAATSAPSADNLTHIPAMTQGQDLGVAKPATPADIQRAIALERLRESKAKILQLQGNLAQNEGCFTLRSYGFTADDLKSDAPRPSTSTTCTPASTGKTKQAKAAILVR